MGSATRSRRWAPASKPSGSTPAPSGSSTERGAARALALVVAASLALGWALALGARPLLGDADGRIGDAFFRLRHALRGPEPIDPSIVHLDLSDTAVADMDMRLGDRSVFAGMLDSLADAGAGSIVLDVIFSDRGLESGDRLLVEAASKAGSVISPLIVAPDGSFTASFPEFAAASRGSGHINAEPDRDGVHRRVPLVLASGDTWVPSLALRTACEALGVDPASIEVVPGSRVRLPDARMRDGTVRDLDIPVDARQQMIVNWAGPWADSFSHYSPVDLLAAADDPDLADAYRDELEGARVIVSDLTTSAGDHGQVPFEPIYPLAGLHANALNGILTTRFLRDQRWYESLLASLAFAVLLWACFRWLRPVAATAAALGCWALLAALQFVLFLAPGIVPRLVAPSLGFVAVAVGANAWRFLRAERDRLAFRLRLERYFAPQLMAKILRSPGRLVGAELKTLTVLFSDIAGFTSWCTGQPPAVIHETLNEYFEEMTGIVFRHEGTVDKFIGDGLMAFFGDPLAQPDHALRAVRSAIEMQLAARRLRAAWQTAGRLPLAIRVGINTGEVVVGDMGSRRITAYTAIGAAVNLAQRLESKAPVGGILVAEPVWQAVRDTVATVARGRISAKGITEEFPVWEVTVPDGPTAEVPRVSRE